MEAQGITLEGQVTAGQYNTKGQHAIHQYTTEQEEVLIEPKTPNQNTKDQEPAVQETMVSESAMQGIGSEPKTAVPGPSNPESIVLEAQVSEMAGQTTADRQSATQEPVAQAPATQEPVAQAPAAQEAATQEPATHEPATQAPAKKALDKQEPPKSQRPKHQNPAAYNPTNRTTTHQDQIDQILSDPIPLYPTEQPRFPRRHLPSVVPANTTGPILEWHWHCCRCSEYNISTIQYAESYEILKESQEGIFCGRCRREVCRRCERSLGMRGWMERGTLRGWVRRVFGWVC
ncbi:hypothetical protein EG328_006824 [Venturia inaequalis]|uniref:Uncharacterized protein n=1 Tax=Venturia inaequalis TaxID=5025 RepID=A0A8H3UHY1_VENIN|nr:hypothetical protein EG328_006824 [Venturia inaequalis]RDI79267.1 hypothetical protein Vi05172_g10743 [Venturia inaequalis]